MTRLCSPWDYSQHEDYPVEEYAQLVHPLLIDGKEMDDMLMQCSNNSVYVLNSSYRYRDFDMIELFGSPAGRALTVNNKTSAELHPCSKLSSSANNITIAAKCSSCISSTNQNHPICHQRIYHPLHSCSFSATCNVTSSSGRPNADNGHFVENSDLIKYRLPGAHPQGLLHSAHKLTNYNKSSRTNSKIAKIWKLFDEDRICKGTSKADNKDNTRSYNNDSTSGLSGSDIFNQYQNKSNSNLIQHEEKTTKDLYNEAAQLLGIKCTLSDSCRCIDCQSQYFDCDDFDAYSEYSDKSCDFEENPIINQSCYCPSTNNYNIGQSHQENVASIACQLEQTVSNSTNQNSILGDRNHANRLYRHPGGANVKFTENTKQGGSEIGLQLLNDSINNRNEEKNCFCIRRKSIGLEQQIDMDYSTANNKLSQMSENCGVKT
ncbi:uncharacterized protein LOC128736031 [Sabethes cyaneus]|uniref:uncharacterized protein LOC128736031 n=1 Tax=Sabethes cyaneus TaxID=53552 RepID=UPI00237E5ED6|nr:uncharacterized protein LOC128736031 [Sabethes cyaneus]